MPNTIPIVIIGGFGSNWGQYRTLQQTLATVSGRPVSVAPISLLEWAGVVASDSYGAMLRVLDQAVQSARRQHNTDHVALVAHSAGGVLARIYLGDQPYGPRRLVYNGFQHISCLVTLGTPHITPNSGRQGGLNQVAFVQQTYPGAYWRFIRYVTVISQAIRGVQNGSPVERGAWQSYTLVAGAGDRLGDGVVPYDNGLLAGAHHIVLDGLRHDQRPGGLPWYGQSEAIVRSWWCEVEQAEHEPTRGTRERT